MPEDVSYELQTIEKIEVYDENKNYIEYIDHITSVNFTTDTEFGNKININTISINPIIAREFCNANINTIFYLKFFGLIHDVRNNRPEFEDLVDDLIFCKLDEVSIFQEPYEMRCNISFHANTWNKIFGVQEQNRFNGNAEQFVED